MGRNYYVLPEYSAILSFVDSIFSEINMGLLIYHLETPGDESQFRLIYANREASHCTGADLQEMVGKLILDAFPSLAKTDLPSTYLEIAEKKEPQGLGVVEYEDEHLERRKYRVKAFPMPSACVGVLFETLRGADEER